MPQLSPLVIALGIVSVVGFLGAIVAYLRDQRTYAGYREIAGAARSLGRKVLRGEVFRDGEDLVAAGNLQNLPTTVRFSYQENTPGLNIRMEAASTFTLHVAPQGTAQMEGKVLVRTVDPQFDTRFVTRSDHPTQARMLLGGRGVIADLQKLCCSSKTYVSITPGAMELSELVIPQPYTEKHVADHLASMARVAAACAAMPDAEDIRILPIQRERAVLGRVAIVVGMVAAMGTVIAGTRAHNAPPETLVNEAQTPGVPPADAAVIPNLAGWRLATGGDYEASARNWLSGQGQEVTGRIEGDFSGSGNGRDVAYVFTRKQGKGVRLVLLTGGDKRYDVEYDSLAIVGRVAKGAIANIQWNGPLPDEPDGDGLLLVLQPAQPDRKSTRLNSSHRL